MEICHLKNAELEPQFQNYKGRVVLRADIVKDDSWHQQSQDGPELVANAWLV